jgi:hypothetical protein
MIDTPSTTAQPPRHCISCGSPPGVHLSWCPHLRPPSGITFTPPGVPLEFPTLRDYFAARSMQAYLGGDWAQRYDKDLLASVAYDMADAMLRARAR